MRTARTHARLGSVLPERDNRPDSSLVHDKSAPRTSPNPPPSSIQFVASRVLNAYTIHLHCTPNTVHRASIHHPANTTHFIELIDAALHPSLESIDLSSTIAIATSDTDHIASYLKTPSTTPKTYRSTSKSPCLRLHVRSDNRCSKHQCSPPPTVSSPG